MADTIKLLEAHVYEKMGKDARRKAADLLKRAERLIDKRASAQMVAQAHSLLGEAVELEMRRIAKALGDTFYQPVNTLK